MPQTVPNRPMKGAVLPIEASSTWPNCSCASTRVQRVAQAARELRFERGPRASSVSPRGAASGGVEQRQQHRFAVERRAAARAPSSSVGAAQKAGTARAMSLRTRRSSQPFQRITHPGADRHQQQQQRDAAA